MKTNKPNAGPKPSGVWQVGLLLLILVIFFWRSFLPDYVHFNNDGPLGQQHVNWMKLPSSLHGMWDDLNDVGYYGGILSVSITAMIQWLLGPVGLAKFYAPIGLFILGLGAWSYFRALKLSALATTTGTLAIVLSAGFFGGACWGIAAVEIAVGLDFIALTLVTLNATEASLAVRLIRLVLAGMCVGINVIEAADVGALSSVFVALVVFYKSVFEESGNPAAKIVRGGLRVAMIAVFAGIIAAQAIPSLIGANITGIAGTGQDTQSKQERWDFATQFSLPKKETLGFIVPGLFGYKYNTPKDMMPMFQDDYKSGLYWGGIGRSPAVDRFLDSGAEGSPPGTALPFGYAGYYCGILVVIVALWAIAQSFRRENSPFSVKERNFIWLWTGIMVLSLLVAWGRFAPLFYGTLYKLPYFSTIRNPTKFLVFFTCSLSMLFAYGMQGLTRRYLDPAGPKPSGLVDQLQMWWKKAGGFDRKWVYTCAAAVALSVLGWLIYKSEMPDLIHYLQRMGYPNDNPDADASATSIAAFSLNQVAWFLGLLTVAVSLVILTISGYFSGKRAKIGSVLLAGFMLFDLGRADLPWVNHWDYKKKYEVGSLNPVVDFLRQKPYEYRVAGLPFEPQQQLGGYDDNFGGNGIYRIEWVQHHFPYYNIQCLDLIEMPRMPEDLKTYLETFAPQSQAELPLFARHWELTNTRYLLGAAGFINVLNQGLDPGKERFRIAQRFDIELKPGVIRLSELEDLTAVPSDSGQLALFDFTGALPRAKLYGNWQVNTNDQANLATLASLSFDPQQTVLVSTPQNDLPAVATNENSGSVAITSYATKHIVLAANATTPSLLLLNDKYDPRWKVTVDGQPAGLLRCNYMMRGVYLQPGKHTVVFNFSIPVVTIYIMLPGVALGLVLCVLLWFLTRKTAAPKPA